MTVFKKGYLKIISLVIAVVFSLPFTAYGINLSKEFYLRVPLLMNRTPTKLAEWIQYEQHYLKQIESEPGKGILLPVPGFEHHGLVVRNPLDPKIEEANDRTAVIYVRDGFCLIKGAFNNGPLRLPDYPNFKLGISMREGEEIQGSMTKFQEETSSEAMKDVLALASGTDLNLTKRARDYNFYPQHSLPQLVTVGQLPYIPIGVSKDKVDKLSAKEKEFLAKYADSNLTIEMPHGYKQEFLATLTDEEKKVKMLDGSTKDYMELLFENPGTIYWCKVSDELLRTLGLVSLKDDKVLVPYQIVYFLPIEYLRSNSNPYTLPKLPPVLYDPRSWARILAELGIEEKEGFQGSMYTRSEDDTELSQEDVQFMLIEWLSSAIAWQAGAFILLNRQAGPLEHEEHNMFHPTNFAPPVVLDYDYAQLVPKDNAIEAHMQTLKLAFKLLNFIVIRNIEDYNKELQGRLIKKAEEVFWKVLVDSDQKFEINIETMPLIINIIHKESLPKEGLRNNFQRRNSRDGL